MLSARQPASGGGVEEEAIHIALTFDDDFWAPAYAVMRSVCLATRRRSNLVFHLCHIGLHIDHRRDLEKIMEEFGARLYFYDIEADRAVNDAIAGLPATAQFPPVVYARLLIDRLLPPATRRVIYLDCDVMVKAPIEDLWHIDLEGRTIAAAPDAWGGFFSVGHDMRANADLYDPAARFFNSGVMLIDLARWREHDFGGKLSYMGRNGTLARLYHDQGFLNLVLRDDVTQLHWRWNLTSPKPEHERLGGAIFHYTGRARPWHLFARVAFHRLYRHVMTNEIFYAYWRHRIFRPVRRMLGL